MSASESVNVSEFLAFLDPAVRLKEIELAYLFRSKREALQGNQFGVVGYAEPTDPSQEHYVKNSLTLYRNWWGGEQTTSTMAALILREMYQNSLDAGATMVNIKMFENDNENENENEPDSSAWLSFADDGKGMDYWSLIRNLLTRSGSKKKNQV